MLRMMAQRGIPATRTLPAPLNLSRIGGTDKHNSRPPTGIAPWIGVGYHSLTALFSSVSYDCNEECDESTY